MARVAIVSTIAPLPILARVPKTSLKTARLSNPPMRKESGKPRYGEIWKNLAKV